MPEEAATVLSDYEQSGDLDIADHLTEVLDVARRSRRKKLISQTELQPIYEVELGSPEMFRGSTMLTEDS